MLELSLSGSPYEIGLQHGRLAKPLIAGSVAFYEAKFRTTSAMSWTEVEQLATEQFERPIRERWPAYMDEMQGVADGSGRPLADILALNVRTEIAFGRFSDGCTSLGWLTPEKSYLAQNWDWDLEQGKNLIMLSITQPGKPTIKMVTEAGIIGKIGLNSAGVGVCLNAIRAQGMDPRRIPCHLGLRLVLESSSRAEAISELEKYGVASSCHMLIADRSGSTGVEWSARDVHELHMNERGQVMHTNHYLVDHPGVIDTWGDPQHNSTFRINRIAELVGKMRERPSAEEIRDIFTDEARYPAAICRGPEDDVATTLFNIVMDLKQCSAKVLMGRPNRPEGEYSMTF